MKREQYATIKVAMPEDVDIYNHGDDYVENTYYLEPDYDKEGDWEIDDWDTVKDNLDAEDIDDDYNEETIWNFDDYKED